MDPKRALFGVNILEFRLQANIKLKIILNLICKIQVINIYPQTFHIRPFKIFKIIANFTYKNQLINTV